MNWISEQILYNFLNSDYPQIDGGPFAKVPQPFLMYI